MQPTVAGSWATWSGWALAREAASRRRVRVSLAELPRRDLAALALYTPDQIRHIIRLESALGRWPPTAPPAWRPDRRAPDIEPWRIPDLIQHVRLEHPSHSLSVAGAGVGVGAGAGGGPPAGGRGWEGAVRGWAAGALLLGALLLLVRALERCLHTRLYKEQRRSSEEWPTPNVFATSRFGNSAPRLEDSEPENREISNNDLPPPYSECANSADTVSNKPMTTEEPPPPYSACYFSNPKNGMPTVHFYSRRRNPDPEMGQSSRDTTNPELKEVTDVICGDRNQISEVRVCDEVNSDMQNGSNEAATTHREHVQISEAVTPTRVVTV